MYEDSGVELAAFAQAGRVLAIASAGDTAAALAAAGHRVTAVDINPVQLDYARQRWGAEFCRPRTRGSELGPTVLGTADLGTAELGTAELGTAELGTAELGTADLGTAERMLAVGRLAARTLPGWRRAELDRFLRLDDPAVQEHWWRDRLDRPAFRALFGAAVRPLAALLPAGLRDVVEPRFDVILRQRLGAAFGRYPNATNPWAWLLLLGHDMPGSVAPVANGVDWVRADVVDHLLAVPAGSYDAATLSNILDGAPRQLAQRLVSGLRHAVRGPAILRSFASKPPIPGRLLPDRALLWGSAVRLDYGE
jgi:hypothetical protein